jgi:hypothetical protein
MKPSIVVWLTARLPLIALGASMSPLACAASLSAHPVLIAVRQGDCDAAIDLVKHGVASNDDQAAFLGGRMLDEGVCVEKNNAAAAQFFERAAQIGNRSASLEYAAKIGLGEGSEQSYERAGEICRTAGFDPKARLSSYSLGYACTVRGLAGRILRETLPAGAFRPDTGATLVDFSPASSELRIRNTPQVARESQAATGSNFAPHRVNPQRVIEAAWRKALNAVPKPDAARLENQAIELSLDVDITLEAGAEVAEPTVADHRFELPFPAKPMSILPPSTGH